MSRWTPRRRPVISPRSRPRRRTCSSRKGASWMPDGTVPPGVTVPRHPLVQHKLTLLRQKGTATADFRQITRELSLLLAYEVTRDLPLEHVPIETPLEPMEAPYLSGKKLCFV